MPVPGRGAQLQVALDSVSVTIGEGDDYVTRHDLVGAMTAYRVAGQQLAALPAVGNRDALIAQLDAIKTSSSVDVAKARAILEQIIALYTPPSTAPTTTAPAASGGGAALFAAGVVAAVLTIFVVTDRHYEGLWPFKKRARK